MEPPIALWWIRRDLRLHDNQALAEAMRLARTVIPIFVLDPLLLASPGQSQRRTQFLLASLVCLDRDLRARGSRLIVRSGDPVEVLPHLASEVGARWVVAEADYSPYALRRDRRVAARVNLRLCPGLTIHDPRELRTSSGLPYTVFTAFARRWWQVPVPRPGALMPPPHHLLPISNDVSSEWITCELDAFPSDVFPPGEAAARLRLDAFVSGDASPIFRYASERNRLDGSGTSRLSPYLRFGMVSAREAWCRAAQSLEAAPDESSRAGVRAWLNELIWREFSISLLYHFPQLGSESLRPEYRRLDWNDDSDSLAAWYEGKTGYPAVDAALRQLATEGWISNRARMLVASFLVKDLLLDWRLGERWFFRHLLDGDPAANSSGWQWSAGTGIDAAPYFRIFNPTTQGERYDPDGRWIRRWVPELAQVPGEFLHRPWTMPRAVQLRSGCRIGRDYPSPIVDHTIARQRVIERYRAARSASTAGHEQARRT